MFNTPHPQVLVNSVQQGLVQIRNAMNVAADLQAWAAGVTPEELTRVGGTPFPVLTLDEAKALLTAIADAYALSCYYNTGLPPAGYPQPGAPYVYGASQRIVIGPRPA